MPGALEAAEANARKAEERLRMALDTLPEGIVFLDAEGRYILWNKTYAEIYSGSSDLFKVGLKLEDTLRIGVARGNYPEAIGREEAWLAQRLSLLANPGVRHEQQLADGRWIMIEERRTPDGGSIGLRVDITELKTALQRADAAVAELNQTQAFLDTVIEGMPAILLVTDANTGRMLMLNRAGELAFGHSRAEVLGHGYDKLFGASEAETLCEQDRRLIATGECSGAQEISFEGGDGSMHLLSVRKMLIRDAAGAPQYVVSACDDITEQRENEQRIIHLAGHDSLTGLPNRVLFNDRLTRVLQRKGSASKVAVLCVDLDRFKTVNDTLGHPVGDGLLRIVADRLNDCVRQGDTVARLGGDEFAVIQNNVEEPADAAILAQRIIENLGRVFETDGHQLVIGASVGIALAPADGESADALLKNADMAMYRAKSEGRGAFRFFEPEMDARLQERRRLELDLRRALVAGEFELNYQPLLNVAEDRISGCEALVRWRHPTRGMVMPGEFIALAEDIGLIVPMGEWIIRQACSDAARLPPGMKMAVNLSPAQFQSPNLVPTVVQALAASGLEPERLELEITESVLLDNSVANLRVLHELRAIGVRI
ncbi:MAG: hypothetical protein BGN86_13695, partial [Caulobacterales bacterium 68-7]